MPEYCSCGAHLPPDARFCHKCGKPQFDYPGVEPVAEIDAAPSIATAVPPLAEIGFHNRIAVRTGFLAALAAFLLMPLPFPPFLQIIWLMACPIGAGFFSAYLYRRRTGQRLGIESGARLGWITGVFVFLIVLVVVGIEVIYLSSQGGLANSIRAQFGGKNPSMEQAMKSLEDPTTLAGGLLLTVVLMFFMFTLLPVVGGALCGKVLDKD